MLNKRALRRIGSGFMAVFAVQLLAASFCAVPASAHVAMASYQSASHQSASYQPVSYQSVQGDCSKSVPVQIPAQYQACAHCDIPDQASGNVAVVVADVKVLAHAALLAVPVSQAPEHIDVLRTRILAPPRSSTLLYTNTRRIRI